MTDNQMMTALILEIERQFGLVGVDSFEVSRRDQPSNQYAGADSDSEKVTQVFIYAVNNPSVGRSRKYGAVETEFKRADTYHKSKILQVSILHYFNTQDSHARTPEDMTNLVRDLLDSPDSIRSLRNKGVFLESAGDVRTIFTTNETDRYESTPNFDLTVVYESSILKNSGYVDHADSRIARV